MNGPEAVFLFLIRYPIPHSARADGKFVDQLVPTPRRGRRRRWKDENGRQIYEEDTQHGELEKYNRKLRHLGTVDPETGEIIKPPVKGRTTGR